MFTSHVDLVRALSSQEPTTIRIIQTSFKGKKPVRVKELINFRLKLSPTASIFTEFVERQFDYGYFAAQLAWYLRARVRSLDGIDHYSDAWKRIKEPDINSNYGVYIWSEGQWRTAVINRLKTDPYSRQAVIMFNRPTVNVSETKDHICTTSLQFLIRHNRLHLIATMRSNEYWFGFCNDASFFMLLQRMTLTILQNSEYKDLQNLQLGDYYHNVGSMHIYEENWDALNRIAENPTTVSSELPEFTIPSIKDVEIILACLGPSEQIRRLGYIHNGHAPEDRKPGHPIYNWFSSHIDLKLKQLHAPTSHSRAQLVGDHDQQ